MLSFGEDIFPNIQSKPPLAQLEAVSSRPVTCYLGKETNNKTGLYWLVSSSSEALQLPYLYFILKSHCEVIS